MFGTIKNYFLCHLELTVNILYPADSPQHLTIRTNRSPGPTILSSGNFNRILHPGHLNRYNAPNPSPPFNNYIG